MRFRFSDCELDTNRQVLSRDGAPVKIEPQVYDLLKLLAENPGRLVPWDEVVEVVWQGRAVSDSAISARVAAARKAVGDDGKTQAVIRTVARRGLEMVAAVTPEKNESQTAAPTSSREVQRIRYTTNTNGSRLAYASLGTGQPVLRFGPPLTTDLEMEWSSGIDWSGIAALSEFFRYIRFDHVGSGQSERAAPRLDFDDQAEDAARVVDAAGADILAGISFSGGVHAALRFAARFPERLSRLIIVGGYSEGRTRRGTPGRQDVLKTMIAEGWHDLDSPFATAFMSTYFPDSPLHTAREMVRQMQQACPVDVMLADRDLINDANNQDLLPLVRCPTLIVHSRHDAIHPLSEAQKLAAGIPDAELVVLDASNHIPLPCDPVWADFQSVVLDFLSATSTQGQT